MRPRAGRSGVQKRQILALMKVPPQQVLAILAAVAQLCVQGHPASLTVGALPGWPVQTEHAGPLGLGRERPGFLVSLEQGQ